MNYRLLVVLILATSSSCMADERISIDSLGWLAGCWSSVGAEPGTGEQWMRPAGGAMLGINRAVRDGRMVGFEYLRIVETEDGSLVLVASPSGQETAEFPLKTITANEVVFENPTHDFPQRVIYRLVDAGKLLGRIEGRSGDGELHVDFPMTQASCDDD